MKNDSGVKDKVVIITGGATGIGAATVKLFAKHGAKVVFVGRSRDTAEALMQQLTRENLQENVRYFQGDVSSESDVVALSQYSYKEFGNCDVLFNNAGVHFAGKLLETPTEEFDRVISVDLKGVFLCCKYFMPQMLEKGGGVIINNSSISGMCADYSMMAYNAAKGGVNNLTRSIAIDYAEEGIRAVAICPGSVLTEMLEYTFRKIPYAEAYNRKAYPTHTFATPEEIAELVLFLASRKVDFLNGACIPIDGGITAHTGQPKY